VISRSTDEFPAKAAVSRSQSARLSLLPMVDSEAPVERTITRRIFEAWSVEIPVTFAETFVDDGSYWHAYDELRSVSLSSILLSDAQGPVSAERIVRELPALEGRALEEMPSGLIGQAATGPAVQPAKAARMLSGLLAVDGRLLIATITSDDPDWACRVWRSIRSHERETGADTRI
jgi:hypothetical protein